MATSWLPQFLGENTLVVTPGGWEHHKREHHTHDSHVLRLSASVTDLSKKFRILSLLLTMEPAFTVQKMRSKVDASYIALIARAILSSPSLRCCLKDIYSFIEEKCPHLPERSPNSWRNSVRHNLSLNDCFVKAIRCENGKGNYWTIHSANLADFLRGDFRRRKAKARIRVSTAANQQQLPLQCGPCVQLIPVMQLPLLQRFHDTPRQCSSVGSETEDSSPDSGTEICTDVEVLDASSCRVDCSDEGSESEDSGVVFVGHKKIKDSLPSHPDAKPVPMHCDVTSSQPAKKLKPFSIGNILSHKTRQKRMKEANPPMLNSAAVNVAQKLEMTVSVSAA